MILMKAEIIGIDGKKAGTIDLPAQFEEEFRTDVIQRSILAIASHDRQPYGTDPWAGTRTSASYRGYRRGFGTWANKGMHRTARIRIKTGYQTGTARLVPQAVKGRKAHPPKAEKIWSQKINAKENRLAIRSAIAATANESLVKARNHHFDGLKLPLIVEDNATQMKKTKEAISFMHKIGLGAELERVSERKIRAGIGKTRGRRYKTKKGPLIVIADDKSRASAFSGIRGIDVVPVKSLNVKVLAPGAQAGRLTIWTKGAIEKLGKEKLFV